MNTTNKIIKNTDPTEVLFLIPGSGSTVGSGVLLVFTFIYFISITVGCCVCVYVSGYFIGEKVVDCDGYSKASLANHQSKVTSQQS